MPVNVSPTPEFMKKFKNVKTSAHFGKKKSVKKPSKLVKAMQMHKKSMMASDEDGDE